MSGCSSEAVAPAALGTFFLLASYLNLNDPDWVLWSSAYALGGAICGWTVLQKLRARNGTIGGTDSSRIRRSVAMTYGAACLGLTMYSAFLAPRPGDYFADPTEGMIVSFLSSEICREAGGALIMVMAMAICATGRQSREKRAQDATGRTTSAGASAVSILSVVVAAAAIVLGVFLPGYLQRAGIAVPAHCGGD